MLLCWGVALHFKYTYIEDKNNFEEPVGWGDKLRSQKLLGIYDNVSRIVAKFTRFLIVLLFYMLWTAFVK